ncbi:MAG: peptidase MA family metallohydrolase [Candidatus Kapaibacteriota bacterium]
MKKFIYALFFFITFQNFVFAQFGKNKVQYQKFNWRYIQTQHFDVYFHDNNKTLAVFTGLIAESSLNSIQRTLKYKVSHRIPIIVYNSHNQFQQTNVIDMYLPEGIGGVTELFKNRVVLPFEGDYEQFRHVIHHELVHAVLNDWFYGGTFQSAISRGNMVEIPLWMNEGLCEWESFGGLDIETDVYIRDLTLSENLPDLANLDGYNAYRGGQTFWWYVGERYGTHKIPELLSKLKSTGNVDNAFRLTFNMRLEDFSNEWRKYLKKFYFPDIDKFSYPADFAIKLTDHKKKRNFYNTSPAISPQGDKVAFIADKDGLFSLFVLDIDKNKEKEIVSSLRQQDFEELNVLTPGISWNPEGNKLAISAKYRGEDVIYIVDVNSKDFQRIPLGFKQISSVSWSQNGEWIAFSATVLDRKDIYLYNLKSKALKQLTNDIFYDDHPTWSSDGKSLFFVSSRLDYLSNSDSLISIKPWLWENDKRDIYRIEIDNGKISRVTYSPEYNKTSLTVSGDGKYIYFVSDENGIGNIYRLELANGNIKPITNSLSNITQVSHSVIAENLVFACLNEGGFDLFMLKNPSSINLPYDTLPLTKFRLSQIDKERKDTLMITQKNKSSFDTTKTNVAYGKYKIDFSRQSMFTSNKDLKGLQQSIYQTQVPLDTDFVDYEYKLKFTPDLILGNPYYDSFWGFQGLAQMLFSDILGDHQIYVAANLWLDLKNSNFFVQYMYLPNVIDYSFSAFQSSLLFSMPNQTTGFYDNFRLRNYGLGFSASYPLSLFNRFEMNFNFFNASKENISDYFEPTLTRTILYPTIRYVYDDVLYGSFAPVRGSRYYLEFRAVPKVFKNSINFFTLKFDYRKYWDFGYFLKLAFRGTGATSFGSNPQRFYLGGVSNWINYDLNYDNFLFNNPEDFVFMELITPLRGWRYSESAGNHFFASNIELRFPLFTALLPGPVPIIFNDILGVVFCDVGGTWTGAISNFKFQPPIVTHTQNNDYSVEPNRMLLSMGVGVRAWILGLPVKMDIAWRKEYFAWSKPIYSFSIDLDF